MRALSDPTSLRERTNGRDTAISFGCFLHSNQRTPERVIQGKNEEKQRRKQGNDEGKQRVWNAKMSQSQKKEQKGKGRERKSGQFVEKEWWEWEEKRKTKWAF